VARERETVAPVPVDLPITLGQFLKAARLVSTGGEAKALIVSGCAFVNGVEELRRGRKLTAGDVVEVRKLGAAVVVDRRAGELESTRPDGPPRDLGA
jgi:ribosome-associated protein